jgi:hypothetical protein
MKRLVLLIFVMSFIGCHRPNNGFKGPNEITVIKIQESRKVGFSWYQIQPKTNLNFRGQTLWFVDSTGKYNIGDIVNP